MFVGYNEIYRINTEVLLLERFLYFIVNKQSRNSDNAFKELLVELPKYTKNYELFITEDIEQLDRLVIDIKAKIQENDLIIVVGGDGSLNQFVTLYKKHQLNNAIGYIPAGSGNDFARAHKLPTNTKKAIDHLFNVKALQKLAIIYAYQNSEKHYAVNSIGIGIDGLINEIVNSGNIKSHLGPFSYLSVLHTAFKKQKKFSLTLKMDNDIQQFNNVQLALVANNPYFGGGVHIIPEANSRDDKLYLLVADNVSLLDLLTIVPKVLISKNHLEHPKLHSFQAKKVKLTSFSEQYGQKDGEVFRQKEFNYSFQTKQLPFWI